MDIYLLEAIINGILLGGVLALLALGLNLIFGVIDVVWIAYADIVMCGMYVIYFLYVEYGVPLPLACLIAIASMAAFGVVVHLLIIAPVLNSAPINQLLATGGLLFFLQSFATLLFGTDFRNIGVRLPILEIGDDLYQLRAAHRLRRRPDRRGRALFVSQAHLYRHRNPRHRAGSRDCRPHGRRSAPHLPRDIRDWRRAGRARRMPAGFAIRRASASSATRSVPVIFMICVLGGLGNMIGGFIASFIISQIIAIGGYYSNTELSYVLAFTFFIVLMFVRPRGIFAR